MKPSEVVKVYRAGRQMAKRFGQEFKLDERRLESWGFKQSQIDAIYEMVDWLEEQERQFDVQCAKIDAHT